MISVSRCVDASRNSGAIAPSSVAHLPKTNYGVGKLTRDAISMAFSGRSLPLKKPLEIRNVFILYRCPLYLKFYYRYYNILIKLYCMLLLGTILILHGWINIEIERAV